MYPLFITAIGAVFFPYQAAGSIIFKDGEPVGSELLAQKFTSDRYFHPRPSSVDFNPVPSGGSNLGPIDLRLKNLTDERYAEFIEKNILPRVANVPPEMLTASGSGVDPHITIESALLQARRVAIARNFEPEMINKLTNLIFEIEETDNGKIFGLKKINVLKLNLALDQLY
ncbi:MAG: potassium-transporting ATPase KdpC subunit [Ignavibacteriales bacterium]